MDVNETVRSAAQLLTDQGVFRRNDLGLALDDGAPVIRGERHELEQMIVNLLLNAADAMQKAGAISVVTHRVKRSALDASVVRRETDPPGIAVVRPLAPRVQHWLETTQPAEIVKIVVADSGPGIPEEDAERIFDPFFTTKEPGQGTGLGLAIVARVVDDLRGTIWVQQAREGGAAFHILFPITPASLTPVSAPSRAALAPRATGRTAVPR